jgi:cysteinyl-tRNA synthetase
MDLLGPTLDIHGGGLDLQFPHHENELAQSECYNGKPFVRYWMHHGLMKVGTGKMSKSLGNEIVVTELLKRHDPETLRFFLLATHYRRPIDYSDERIEEIRRGLDGFYRFFERYERITRASFYRLEAPRKSAPFAGAESFSEFLSEVGKHRQDFLDCMDDDFNTGGAVGMLFELLSALNRFADAQQLESGQATAGGMQAFQQGAAVIRELGQILGVFETPPRPQPQGQSALLNDLMQLFIELRAEARKGKNFALADQIRTRLGKLGVTLEDRPGGTDWRLEGSKQSGAQ